MTASPAGPESRQAIEAQASEFVARLQGDVDARARRAIHDWIEADPHHAVAFARMEAAWEAGERLRACPPPVEAKPEPEAAAAPHPFLTRRNILIGSAAATLVAAVGTAIWRYAQDVELYRTRLGERREVRLADGSRIHLNTASTVEVSLREDSRRVRLVKGEALFEVAHDPNRPFLVDAGAAKLRAVGTAFNVRIREAVVELTVTEGVVAVAENVAAVRRVDAQRVAAGDGAVIRGGAVAPTVLNPNLLRQRVAWQDGVIELDGETLSQAVDEFNRYRDRPIIVGDPRLANLRVGGRFEVDEAAKFLTAVEGSFPVQAITANDGSILLVMRS
ncbi:FecR family protein [Caulobacter segnis]|uniref:FecR family protein n=1 Tax=Caulobacter segnis TaxID=88688 RepID=UPI001CBF2B60|nr:FecR domain-containing protein [Caulobacter segnis]UAL09249.1 FecR domain-containing protein [Caulobacter segnis]